MPEPYTDEGTENRERYFCSHQNRCSRCINAEAAGAGAGKVTLQNRRCPGDGTSYAADSDRKTSHDESKSSSASSSELPQATWSHETDGELLLVDDLAQMSLTGSHATSSPALSVVTVAAAPRVEKRKAVVELGSQAKHQKKQLNLEFEFSGLAVEEWLENKPQKIFQDANVGNVPVCWSFPEALYAGRPRASFVAGCSVSAEAEGQGSLFPCFHDIHTPGGVLPWSDEIEEI